MPSDALAEIRAELAGLKEQFNAEIRELSWDIDLAVAYMREFAKQLGIDERLTELNDKAAARALARQARSGTS